MENLPLFERSSRRALLRMGLGATGVLAAGAVLAACGSSDGDTFASDTTASGAVADTTAARAGSSDTTTAATAPTEAPTTVAAADSGAAAPAPAAGNGVTLSFSYTPSDSGGRVRNPYIAAWIEDDAKTLVGVVSLWYSTREAKYLRELTEFTAISTELTTDEVDGVTGATRQAGSYDLSWDGTGLDGSALTGTYTLWVEAAREHGPHSVTSGPITLGQAGSATLTGDGELSDIVVTAA